MYVASAEHHAALRGEGVTAAQALLHLIELHGDMLDVKLTFRRLNKKQLGNRRRLMSESPHQQERPAVPSWAVEMIKSRNR